MSSIYQPSTAEIRHKRRDLTPAQQAAFEAFSNTVFSDGALPAKLKQIIAVSVAHVTQCPYCGPYQGGTARGSLPRRTDGGNLGCS